MDISNFIKQYIKNPQTVGAVAPSSEKLAYKMVEDIKFAASLCFEM